jgi:hypothetical protein
MIAIILSIGAINAFIPLIIILILIVAAAGLMRGYNIFALFGISALLGGAGKATLAGKNVASKTAGVRKGLIMGKKAQALGGYIQKEAIPKGVTFAKYYKQEYSAAIASGASKANAAKIAYSNARTRMMYAKINTFQSGLNNGIEIYQKIKVKDKNNIAKNKVVKVRIPLPALLGMLKAQNASSALKNDTHAQILYTSINSQLSILNNLAAQANQIQQQLNRTSAVAAKANLERMRQLMEDYKKTAHNLIKDIDRYGQRYHTNRNEESIPYYFAKTVNRVIPNLFNVPPPPSFLDINRRVEPRAHVYWDKLHSDLEKSFKEAFKP